jgi:transcriptional regulator with XRE-family HTH domain
MFIVKILAPAIALVNSKHQFIKCYDAGDNQMMTDKQKNRLNNLKRLVKQFDSIASFSRNYDLDPSYISQLLNGHRNVGEKAAMKLEAKLGRPHGWLDLEPGEEGSQALSPLLPEIAFLTPRQRVLLGHFEGLTEAQQDEVIRLIQKQEQDNRTVVDELAVRLREKGKRSG